jgi:hypothetical protein
MQIIIYPQDNDEIAMVFPTGELPVAEVALKDVPAGKPYFILDSADVPADFSFSSAWSADFSNPHGHGLGHDAWAAQYVDPMAVYDLAHAENAQFNMLQALKQAPQTLTSGGQTS